MRRLYLLSLCVLLAMLLSCAQDLSAYEGEWSAEYCAIETDDCSIDDRRTETGYLLKGETNFICESEINVQTRTLIRGPMKIGNVWIPAQYLTKNYTYYLIPGTCDLEYW